MTTVTLEERPAVEAEVFAAKPKAERGSGGAKTPAAPKNIYQRLTAVRREVGTITKGGTAAQIMGGYKYVQWEEVADRVGGLFATHGIVPCPSIEKAEVVKIGETRAGAPIYRATVDLTIGFVNEDDPHDQVFMSWVGTGDDGGDKAIQKAATSGMKYALMKLLMLGGAEDPDGNGEESKLAGAKVIAPAPPRSAPPNRLTAPLQPAVRPDVAAAAPSHAAVAAPATEGGAEGSVVDWAAFKGRFDAMTSSDDREMKNAAWRVIRDFGWEKGSSPRDTFNALTPERQAQALKEITTARESFNFTSEPFDQSGIPW